MGQFGLYSSRKSSKFRGIVNGSCSLILFYYFFNRVDILKNHLLTHLSSNSKGLPFFNDSGNGSVHISIIRRQIADISDNSSHLVDGSGLEPGLLEDSSVFCFGLSEHVGFSTQCEYLRAHPECSTGGFFDYLQFFYCDCQKLGVLGYAALVIWLATLFYLLGNTAADYFSFSLEKLSRILNLSPTVAGVTLLPLGNGASDVFASIAAFMGTGSGDVGLNSVLGGAVFVTCVVVGVVSLLVSDKQFQIDRLCFIRDLSFFIIAILSLLWILVVGKVTVGAAIAYLMIYVLYALVVGFNEMLRKRGLSLKLNCLTPLLPVVESISRGCVEDDVVCNPLLQVKRECDSPLVESFLPQWMWPSNGGIYSNQSLKLDYEGPPWGWNDEHREIVTEKSVFSCPKLLSLLELPLSLPRRLTIPRVQEETWSKPYAVASASLAPILLMLLWSIQGSGGSVSKEVVCVIGLLASCVFGVLAYRYTQPDHPPETFLLPWVLGGFVMSITWFYIIAGELVALLVCFGVILGINPSILGLTLLAWGNSTGDLMSNVALALNGGGGIQIALSGCYAGPMFNTLFGLGMSLLLGALSSQPASYILPEDNSLFYTIGFVLTGLIWAIVVFLWQDMRPSKVLGIGLIALYLVFLFFGVANAVNMSA